MRKTGEIDNSRKKELSVIDEKQLEEVTGGGGCCSKPSTIEGLNLPGSPVTTQTGNIATGPREVEDAWNRDHSTTEAQQNPTWKAKPAVFKNRNMWYKGKPDNSGS